MKLTERQIKIRSVFRNSVLAHFSNAEKFKMFNTIVDVCNALDLPFDDARAEMAEIPSIGKFRKNMPCAAWLASHFKPVSNALYDGVGKEAALNLWVKTKRTDGVARRDVHEKMEMARNARNNRKNKAFAELHKNMGDRWDATSWSKVK